MHVIKKIDPVVGPVYFDQNGNTVFEVSVAGNATVANGKEETRVKSVTLQRNALLDRDAIHTMQEVQMIESLAIIHAPANEQPLNEKAADVWWKGTTPSNSYLASRKHSNGVDCFDIAVSGPEALVFKQENANGKLVRYWLNKDTNLTARIRYVNTPSHPASWRLEVYRNERRDGKWHGARLVEHYIHRTVTNESELTVAKYVAVYFARFS